MNLRRPPRTVLPRSLDPLEGESLIGFLLRLAHRLDIAPGELAVICGLELSPRLITSRLLALDDAGAFAAAARLTRIEADNLTLAPVGKRYGPISLAYCGRTRTTIGLFVKENWVFSASTRYCPACLAGDGSPIQNAHGGPWSRTWRLPVVFGCTRHNSLLMSSCPRCGQPAHAKSANHGLLPAPKTSGLHPAACRSADGAGDGPVCGNRLDGAVTAPLSDEHLRLQQRLEDLLLGTAETGKSISAARSRRYFNDLRVLSCLISASWPAAEAFCDDPQTSTLIGRHVAAIRETIDAVRATGRVVRELNHYDRPPLDPATGAALLALADRFTGGDPGPRQQALAAMLAGMPPNAATAWWLRQFRSGGYCSPRLTRGLTAVLHPPAPLIPPPRPVAFAADHIPHRLPDRWFDAHLAHLTAMRPVLRHRAAALHLAQLVVGGSREHAAGAIGMPAGTATSAIHEMTKHTAAEREAFEDAAESLAAMLDAQAPALTSYGHRRRALRGWMIDPEEWDELVADLRAADTHRDKTDRPTDWADIKRLSASAWVWAHVTGSETRFAPAFNDSPLRSTPYTLVGATSGPRYHLARRDYGHYAALRTRLTTYAAVLADRIDQTA